MIKFYSASAFSFVGSVLDGWQYFYRPKTSGAAVLIWIHLLDSDSEFWLCSDAIQQCAAYGVRLSAD